MKKGLSEDGLVYHAGFPNAGEDQHGISLSLDSLLVRHHASTFFWRLDDIGIPELHWAPGSIVVVDRALQPKEGDFVVAVIDEEFVVRIVQHKKLKTPSGEIEAADTIVVWGVITAAIERYRS